MGIGRISGPMLFSNLERQGLDLAIEGNLVYFDVNQHRVGINTDSPEYDVHIASHNGTLATLLVEGNIIVNNTLTIANAYSLTTETGSYGQVLSTDGNNGTFWSSSLANIERKQFNHRVDSLSAGSVVTFVMDIGISSIVYALTVSRPCLVEVFGTANLNESNPYTFLATLDHLTDDGSVLLDDGSVIQQRQYSIFANQEEPIQSRVYAQITNIDGVDGLVDVKMTYFASVTDSRSGIYDMNIVEVLPVNGYTGQTVLLKSNNKLQVWYDNQWNQVTS